MISSSGSLYHNVPPQLRAEPRWFAYILKERKGGGFAKIPVSATGKKVNASDQDHWRCFDAAVECVTEKGFAGICFALAEHPNLVVVDIDHCIDENGCLSDTAQELVRRLGSYTERSPSGRGVHIWIESPPPGPRKRLGGLEFLSGSGFVTVTGDRLPESPSTISNNSGVLATIYDEAELRDKEQKSDEAILRRCRTGQNGAQFRQLYDRKDLTPVENDESRADFAVLLELAKASKGDPATMDRLFRRSRLMRPDKWDAKRGNSTYGFLSIEKAIEAVDSSDTRGKRRRAAPFSDEQLVALADPLWVRADHEDRCWAAFPEASGFRTVPLVSRHLTAYFRSRVYDEHNLLLSKERLENLLLLLEARALQGERVDTPSVRLTRRGSRILLDLANERNEVVEISPSGYLVRPSEAGLFWRPPGIAPLPTPSTAGNLSPLRSFLNIDDSSFALVLGFLVASMRPEGPFPALILRGEQGSAKSTTARLLRQLIDPASAPLLSPPKDEQNLMLQADQAWLLVWDNLSRISESMSDALCRLASGGGLSLRKLYTNRELETFSSRRPFILTGIDDVASRADLLDRSFLVELQPIPDSMRRTEREIDAKYQEALPVMLGGLCSAVVEALRQLPSIELPEMTRLADISQWVVAAEGALPVESGGFLSALQDSRVEATRVAVESDVLFRPLRQILSNGPFVGSATALLSRLNELQSSEGQPSPSWPKAPNALTGRLRRLAPALRGSGIEVQLDIRVPGTGERKIRLVLRKEEPNESLDQLVSKLTKASASEQCVM